MHDDTNSISSHELTGNCFGKNITRVYVFVNLLLMIYVLTFVCVFFWNCETSKKIHHIRRHYPFKLNSDVYLYINDKFMKKEKEIYMFLNILYQGACENNLRNNRLVDDLILQFKSVRYMCQHLILITSIEISHSFSCVFFFKRLNSVSFILTLLKASFIIYQLHVLVHGTFM